MSTNTNDGEETSTARRGANVDYNYDDNTNINGNGYGKLPYFDGKNFSHYKHKMKMYLRSVGLPVWKIVETGYRLENEANPTPTDERNMHKDSSRFGHLLIFESKGILKGGRT